METKEIKTDEEKELELFFQLRSLSEERKLYGMTQTELAKKAGVDVRIIREIEHGKKIPGRTILDKIFDKGKLDGVFWIKDAFYKACDRMLHFILLGKYTTYEEMMFRIKIFRKYLDDLQEIIEEDYLKEV